MKSEVKKELQDEATTALIKSIKNSLIDERSAKAIFRKITKSNTRNQTSDGNYQI